MHYEITSKVITFFIESEKRKNPSKSTFGHLASKLSNEDLERVCSALVLQFRHMARSTQRTQLLTFLKTFLAYFESSGSAFPESYNEWQLFLLNFFQFYLTDTSWSQATTKTRSSEWGVVATIFKFWVAEELVPIGVVIPSITKKSVKSFASQQPLLGKDSSVQTPQDQTPMKTLVNVNFAATADIYLAEVERLCREKISIIQSVCLAHWEALMSDGAKGRKLSKSSHQIQDVIDSGVYAEKMVHYHTPISFASPAHPEGYKWGISVTRELLKHGVETKCVSTATIQKSEFFIPSIFRPLGYSELETQTSMPVDAFMQLTNYAQFARFVELLSSLDAAVACCLLSIEHPEFTSESLQNAKLLNARGKSYLLVTDNAESALLSLDKPRARRRKTVTLTPTAQKLVNDIIAWTALTRAVMKNAGDKAWRYLFVGFGKGGNLCALSPTTVKLTSLVHGRSLIRLYPILQEHGLFSGTFDYRRIRTTMGVLRWFETGSIKEMSIRLGNSNRVALEHYLPRSLLYAWNTRIIRRFQNTLIVIAAFNEDFLLDVTDFSSPAELQDFILQLLSEYPAKSSPLAKILHRRFDEKFSTFAEHKNVGDSEAVLNLRLSPLALSCLYAYSDYSMKTMTTDKLIAVDVNTNLSPMQFVELARMIRHACENEVIASDLRELLDVSRLRQIHHQAIAGLPSLAARISHFSVNKQQ